VCSSDLDVYKRCVNNYFYDQINMGTQNFILSLFETFCGRYPTKSELAAATRMVDGQSSIAFFEEGGSKADFINIFFRSNDYYEGQVYLIFRAYLYRRPTQTEMTKLAADFRATNNLKTLQKYVLSLDEYVGLKN